MVTDRNASMKSRVTEHIVQAFLSAVVLVLVGWISGYVELKSAVAGLKVQFAEHERKNAEYRERTAKDKENDDKKWDYRIQRIENCFIVRNCGVK